MFEIPPSPFIFLFTFFNVLVFSCSSCLLLFLNECSLHFAEDAQYALVTTAGRVSNVSSFMTGDEIESQLSGLPVDGAKSADKGYSAVLSAAKELKYVLSQNQWYLHYNIISRYLSALIYICRFRDYGYFISHDHRIVMTNLFIKMAPRSFPNDSSSLMPALWNRREFGSGPERTRHHLPHCHEGQN